MVRRFFALLLFAVIGLDLTIGAGADVTLRIQERMDAPRWAVLERQLLAANLPALREFFDKYFDRRGYLRAFCVISIRIGGAPASRRMSRRW